MNLKKVASLMIVTLMIINPLAGVLAEGTAADTTVVVEAPDNDGNREVTEQVDAIEVTGTDNQTGAEVSAEGDPDEGSASAELTVDNDIQVTSSDSSATGADVKASGDQGNANLTAGDVTSEGVTETTGIVASSSSGYEVSSSYSEDSGQYSRELVGSDNKATANTGDVNATSTEGPATGVTASANGDENTTTVTVADVTAKGKEPAIGITASTSSGSNYNYSSSSSPSGGGYESSNTSTLVGSDNKTTVNAEDVNATSTEGNATGVTAYASGDENTTTVTVADVTAKGKESAIGITASTSSGENTSYSSLYSPSTGSQYESSEKLAGSDNKAVIKAEDVEVTSTEGSAKGVTAYAFGDKNTADVTAKDVIASGKTEATGIEAESHSGTNRSYDDSQSSSELVGSENKATVNVGDVNATATDEEKDWASSKGVYGYARSKGNVVDVTTGNITAGATAIGGSSKYAYATGVDIAGEEGGKATVTTGDIEVIALSESKPGEDQENERSSSEVSGVYAEASGDGSEVTITTGNVTAEATANGGFVKATEGYVTNSAYTHSYGSAVELTAEDSGNISYTADGDVILKLTANMEEREAKKGEEPEPSGETGRTEVTGGIYAGSDDAGLKISVVGSDSEVAAIIKGNVEAELTVNRSDYDEPNTSSDVAGVVIGDEHIGKLLIDSKYYTKDEEGNEKLSYESKKDGSYISYYSDGKTKSYEHNETTGITTNYYDTGIKRYQEDSYGNYTYYDESGNIIPEWSRGELKEKTAEELGTANVKVEGDITSNGVGLEVVPTLSGGEINVIVEGTIKGETDAILVNDNVDAGNFTLTVWKIEPTAAYDENGEVTDEENFLSVATVSSEGYKDNTEKAEELLKQVQYIIKVDPNLTNAKVNLSGTTRFTDFTGEEYDVAHEDDTVVVKISADAGYEITGAFNGEGRQETLLRDSEGNYYIIVPRGGGVYLTATVAAIDQGSPEEEKKESSKEQIMAKKRTWADYADLEPNGKVVFPAASRLLKSDERKAMATLSPMQQLLVILTKAGYGEAVAASGFALTEEAKQVLDSLTSDLGGVVQKVYKYENGVKVVWRYAEMILPVNLIVRFAFRQLEDGSWVYRIL